MRLGVDEQSLSVIWHDVECGAYAQDLTLWRTLADRHGDPVLEVGAGTGRVTLDLARSGHQVTALDREPQLIEELARRAGRLAVTPLVADGREFELGTRFSLVIVPMQTIQLFGGSEGRRGFLVSAARHLRPGGVVAVAITEMLEPFTLDDGFAPPMPDVKELDGLIYSSQPTAVRVDQEGYVLERLRERIERDGRRRTWQDRVRLDRLTPAQLEREAGAAQLRPLGREVVPPTRDYVGSMVVVLGG